MSGAIKHPNRHPLHVVFGVRGLHWREGMNLLQEGPELFISDLCVTPEEVHPADIAAVLQRAGAPWAVSQIAPWQPDFPSTQPPHEKRNDQTHQEARPQNH
jgi:hypothetical protein